MLAGVSYRARLAARRAAIGLVGAMMLLVGLVLLSAALWLFLADRNSALFATTILGLGYAGLGLIILAMSSIRPARYRVRPAAPPPDPNAALISAFLGGLTAGVTAAKGRGK